MANTRVTFHFSHGVNFDNVKGRKVELFGNKSLSKAFLFLEIKLIAHATEINIIALYICVNGTEDETIANTKFYKFSSQFLKTIYQ